MKLKTSSSASKRVKKISKSGKYLALSTSAQHRGKGKSPRTKRKAMRTLVLSKANSRKMRILLPYL